MKTIAWFLPLLLLVAIASWGCDVQTDNPAQAGDSAAISTSAGQSCCGGTPPAEKTACEGCGNVKGSPECCSDKS